MTSRFDEKIFGYVRCKMTTLIYFSACLHVSCKNHLLTKFGLYIFSHKTINCHSPETSTMLFSCPFFTNSVASIFTIFMFIFFLIWISRRVQRTATKQRSVLPEAGGAWPLVGHLHHSQEGHNRLIQPWVTWLKSMDQSSQFGWVCIEQ